MNKLKFILKLTLLLIASNIFAQQNPHDNNSVSCIIKADTLYKECKFDSALIYYKKALNTTDIEEYKAEIYSKLGNVYLDLSSYNNALYSYKQSLKLYKKSDNKHGLSSVLNLIGNVYYRWSDFEKAIKYYDQSLKIRKEIGDKDGMPSSLNNLGNIYFSWGKFDKALEKYLKAYELKQQQNDKTDLPSYIINIGSAYLSLNKYDEAEKYYKLALQTSISDNNKQIISTCYINIGVLNLAKGNNERAIQYYNKAYKIILDYGSKLEKAYVLRNIGEAYIKINKMNFAKEKLLLSLEIAKKEHLNSLVSEVYMFLYIVEKAEANYKKALDYYTKSTNLNDSIFNDSSIKKLNELQSKYEYEKKENEIKEKDLELAEKQKQIQLQRFWFTASAIIILIIIIIVYLVYKNKTTKKRIQLENALRQQMQQALSAQMNPHFISNALNSIQRYFLNNDIEIANEYLSDFGALIRTILEQSRKSQITLSEEIKSIELYMSLEALRLENKFEYEIIIDSKIDVENSFIPPIILQPYIENAIWHGIAPSDTKGKINIIFKVEENFLTCIIQDDGIGIDKSKELKKQYNKKHKSLGMSINKKRIELLNTGTKNKFSVEISDLTKNNTNLTGTKVIIKMPYARS